MGISYDSEHGIGYELNISEKLIEQLEENGDSLFDYLEAVFEDCKVGVYTNAGNHMSWDADEFGHFLFIQNPFENGITGLVEKIEALQDYVIVNQIEVSDNGIGVYGEVSIM